MVRLSISSTVLVVSIVRKQPKQVIGGVSCEYCIIVHFATIHKDPSPRLDCIRFDPCE